MTKVGPKEAQRRAQRESAMIETGSAPTRKMTVKEALERYPAPRKPPASEPKGVKGVTEQPNRLGRRPTLTKADHDMVVAAQWQELAVALRWYRAQLAGARKRRIKA